MSGPAYHARTHRPGGTDPLGPWDSTDNVGDDFGIRSDGAADGDVLTSDGAGGSIWEAGGGGGGGLELVSFTTITSSVTVSGTTDGTATTIITAPAFTADGTSEYAFTVYTPNAVTGSGSSLLGNLFEDGTSVGRLFGISPPSGSMSVPVMVTGYRVPASGSRTFSWRCWRSSADGTIVAGAGGATQYRAAYLRIERVT